MIKIWVQESFKYGTNSCSVTSQKQQGNQHNNQPKQWENKHEIENKVQQKNQKILLLSELDFSHLRPLIDDPTGQIEVPRVTNLLSKFQPDPTVNEGEIANLVQLLYFMRKWVLLFLSHFSLASLFEFSSLTDSCKFGKLIIRCILLC